MKIEKVGANGLMLYFGDEISLEVSKKVTTIYQNLKARSIKGIISLVPSYTSLLITYDLLFFSHKSVISILMRVVEDINSHESDIATKLVKIPVYYDIEVGFDLEIVANKAGLSVSDVIKIHSEQIYNVYAIGFAPGYAYMGLIDEKIQTPRLETPRKKVPKGSVSIADRQTAIYPSVSPGGWNIIGRTPYDMFDNSLEGLCLVSVGDSVKFEPICKEEFLALGGKL